ncbi:hypothetical protein JG687_00001335 [Phytophthora cactorum]|uniref:Uncharacterized protein n=1 Tax=Phytophthora cactorum TaxID=29920 RepID=A0A8T1V039_9STRA|nr:hypothetical protein JG687_00001335 [Phytophthora cactorum]
MVVGSGVSEKDARNLHIMEVSAGRMVEKRAAIIQDVRRLCNRRGNAFFMVVESGAREKDAQNPHSTVCAKRMVERNHARILGVPNKPRLHPSVLSTEGAADAHTQGARSLLRNEACILSMADLRRVRSRSVRIKLCQEASAETTEVEK